jgi:hypothetical protein
MGTSKLKYLRRFVTNSCISPTLWLALTLSLVGCGWIFANLIMSSGVRSGDETPAEVTLDSEVRTRSHPEFQNKQRLIDSASADNGDGQGVGGTGITILEDEVGTQKHRTWTQEPDQDRPDSLSGEDSSQADGGRQNDPKDNNGEDDDDDR